MGGDGRVESIGYWEVLTSLRVFIRHWMELYVIVSFNVIARNEAIFNHVMVSAVEPSVRLPAYRSFDYAQDDTERKSSLS